MRAAERIPNNNATSWEVFKTTDTTKWSIQLP